MSGPQPQLGGSARDSVSGRDATRSKSLAETKKGGPQNWSHVRREGLRLRPPRTRGVMLTFLGSWSVLDGKCERGAWPLCQDRAWAGPWLPGAVTGL